MTAVSQHQGPLASLLTGKLSGNSPATDPANRGIEGARGDGIFEADSSAVGANFKLRLEQARTRQADSSSSSTGQIESDVQSGPADSEAVATIAPHRQAAAEPGALAPGLTATATAPSTATFPVVSAARSLAQLARSASEDSASTGIANDGELAIAGSEDTVQEDPVDLSLPGTAGLDESVRQTPDVEITDTAAIIPDAGIGTVVEQDQPVSIEPRLNGELERAGSPSNDEPVRIAGQSSSSADDPGATLDVESRSASTLMSAPEGSSLSTSAGAPLVSETRPVGDQPAGLSAVPAGDGPESLATDSQLEPENRSVSVSTMSVAGSGLSDTAGDVDTARLSSAPIAASAAIAGAGHVTPDVTPEGHVKANHVGDVDVDVALRTLGGNAAATAESDIAVLEESGNGDRVTGSVQATAGVITPVAAPGGASGSTLNDASSVPDSTRQLAGAAGASAVDASAMQMDVTRPWNPFLVPERGIEGAAPLLSNSDFAQTSPIAPRTVGLTGDVAAEGMAANVRWMVDGDIRDARVNVSPAGLGPLSIHVAMEGDAVSVSIVASQTASRELIDAMVPRLREQLASQGHETVHVDVSTGSGGEHRDAGNTGFAEGRQAAGSELDVSETSEREVAMTSAGTAQQEGSGGQGLIDAWV